jgi:hypothetical protein
MFKIKDKRRVPLPVQNAPLGRWERRAIINYGTREFMVFIDTYYGGAAYIEEIVGGHLEKIKDNKLHDAMSTFVETNGLITPLPPLYRRHT